MGLCVAIIGSGPAGYYTAEGLVKVLGDDVNIDIIDRLPTPYGLIRGGVAPDHQSIKLVYRRYQKTNVLKNVRFVGNVEIGRDIALTDLEELYDAVVIATGAPADRKMGVAGEELPGVWGSAAFVGWYNAHPDFADLDIDLDVKQAVVIGNGNVAIDVARVLAKTREEMATSDIAAHAAQKIHESPLERIYIVGRRGPLEASFTPKELGELGALERYVALVEPAQLPDDIGEVEPVIKKNMSHFSAFAQNREGDKEKTLSILFFARPVEILGTDRVTGVRFERTRVENGNCVGTKEYFELGCGLVVSCIGYRSIPIPGAEFDARAGRYVNDEGYIRPGLYATGWSRRGPSGTIGTNRPDGFEVAEHIASHVEPGDKSGREGLDRLARERGIDIVTFRDWKKIEAAETAAAVGGAPRAKFSTLDELLAAINASS